MTDGRAIAYSEREREFAFAKKGLQSTRNLKMLIKYYTQVHNTQNTSAVLTISSEIAKLFVLCA